MFRMLRYTNDNMTKLAAPAAVAATEGGHDPSQLHTTKTHTPYSTLDRNRLC